MTPKEFKALLGYMSPSEESVAAKQLCDCCENTINNLRNENAKIKMLYRHWLLDTDSSEDAGLELDKLIGANNDTIED